MVANPLDHFRHRKTESAGKTESAELPFRASEWGPPGSWPVPRAEGEPLVFQMRLPVEIELVDVPSLARQARGAPGVVAQGAAELEQVAGPAGLILVGALRPSDVPEAEREILATLTVAFSDKVKGPLSAEDFHSPDSERTVKSSEQVVEISDKVKLIERASMESLGEGMDPVLMILLEYLIETRYGALVMAFSTANQEMMTPLPRKLYERIVETTFIGEQAPPD